MFCAPSGSTCCTTSTSYCGSLYPICCQGNSSTSSAYCLSSGSTCCGNGYYCPKDSTCTSTGGSTGTKSARYQYSNNFYYKKLLVCMCASHVRICMYVCIQKLYRYQCIHLYAYVCMYVLCMNEYFVNNLFICLLIPYSYTCTAKSSGCFAGFETVTMESGERKAIGEVSVGDKILAYSPTRVTNCIRCTYYMYCMYERVGVYTSPPMVA